MNVNGLDVRRARRGLQYRQRELLFVRDERGHRTYDDDLNPVMNLDLAPLVLKDRGVPRTLSGATLATSFFTEVEPVRQWYVQHLRGTSDRPYLALLLGDGANYTAAALARNAVKRNLTISWYSWHAFTRRYTDAIARSRLLASSTGQEQAEVVQEVFDEDEEDFRLRYVYDLVVFTDFVINDVRDFAVPDICSMFRDRSDAGLVTIVTVATIDAAPLEREWQIFGQRGVLLQLFEEEGEAFDGR